MSFKSLGVKLKLLSGRTTQTCKEHMKYKRNPPSISIRALDIQRSVGSVCYIYRGETSRRRKYGWADICPRFLYNLIQQAEDHPPFGIAPRITCGSAHLVAVLTTLPQLKGSLSRIFRSYEFYHVHSAEYYIFNFYSFKFHILFISN